MQVKIVNVTSRPTRVTTGLWQGDAMSPVLFNLVLKRVKLEMNILEGVILLIYYYIIKENRLQLDC